MNRLQIIFIFLFAIFTYNDLFSISPAGLKTDLNSAQIQDTIKDNQNLYSGKVWTNKYHRINKDQFLFSGYFLPGTVSANGKTYKNLLLRYDIYSDEITIPVSREDIVQLNKEMVDSFSINYESKVYRFVRIKADTLESPKGFRGYLCVLYDQKSALCLKFIKDISPNITEQSDGEFVETDKIYLIKDRNVFLITTLNDFYKLLNQEDFKIRDYVKKNKIKISKDRPESLIPVIRYYDSKSQQRSNL